MRLPVNKHTLNIAEMKKAEQDQARFWRLREYHNMELLRASFTTHVFARHAHEEYVIGVIEDGVEAFHHRGVMQIAPAGSLLVINPGEVHTGYAADEDGWAYRVMYPEAAILVKAAAEFRGRKSDAPFFREPVIRDLPLVRFLRDLHCSLEESFNALESQSLLLNAFVQLIARHSENRPRLREVAHEHHSVKRVREYLEEDFSAPPSLDQLAQAVGLSPFHLIRVFQKEFGLPPHAYLTQVRIKRARALLAAGWPLAEVAQETGFADQSHFTRRFKSLVGVTPGIYAQSNFVQDALDSRR